MRRVRTENILENVPGRVLLEAFQDHRSAAKAKPQYFSANLLSTGEAEVVIATADGLTTGLISGTTRNIEITSDTVAKQVSLPVATDGKLLRLHCSTTGCELISVVAGDKVNNVVVGATNEAALIAGTVYTLRYVASTSNWVMTGLTATGAVEAPVVPNIL